MYRTDASIASPFFLCEICPEIGVGLYTGVGSDTKNPKHNIAHYTLFLGQFVFVYVCSWQKVY